MPVNKKGFDLPDLSSPATGDILIGVDVSDTTDSADGSTKKFTLGTLASWLASLAQTLTNKTLTSPKINENVVLTAKSTELNLLSGLTSLGILTTTQYAPQGFLINGKIVVSVSSNNITVAIKGMDGNNPSASNPVYCRIGDTVRTITAALSVTKNAGTNWFNAGGSELATKEIDYFVYLGYNATDGVTIGFSRIPYAKQYSDFNTTSTDAKYAAISTITTAASTDYYENVGRFAATLSAGAGYTWTVPTFTAINLIQRPIFSTRNLDFAVIVAGTASMTTATPTVTRAKYKIIDDKMFIELGFSTVTAGTASYGILPNMPMYRNNSVSGLNMGSGALGDGGADIQAIFKWNGTSTTQALIEKHDAVNYGLITVAIWGVQGQYTI